MCGHQHHRHHDHRRHGRTWPQTTVPDDDVRASDAERERTVAALRTAAGEGRLTVEELDERLTAAYAARTRRDLVGLTRDLPRTRTPRPDVAAAGFAEHLRSYVLVMALLVAIWALTGMGYFWPVWPALGWGIGVLSHAGAARRPPRRRPA